MRSFPAEPTPRREKLNFFFRFANKHKDFKFYSCWIGEQTELRCQVTGGAGCDISEGERYCEATHII